LSPHSGGFAVEKKRGTMPPFGKGRTGGISRSMSSFSWAVFMAFDTEGVFVFNQKLAVRIIMGIMTACALNARGLAFYQDPGVLVLIKVVCRPESYGPFRKINIKKDD